MKIRIITFQNAYNYGGSLQCYALQKKIKELGYDDVEVVNYKNKYIDDVYKIVQIPRKKKLYLLRLLKSFIRCIPYAKGTYERNKKFKSFINENIPLTEMETRDDIISKEYSNKDVFIVGSDQVWNTEITNGYDLIYTLDFNDSIKKISYAASFGFDNIEEKYIDGFKKSLSKFNHISVREETGKNIINSILTNPVAVVLDPTLLLERNEWSNLVQFMPKEKEKYIFVYMMTEEAVKIANYISKKTGLKIIYMTSKNEYNNPLRSAYNDGPYEFIKLIEGAEYVVTTSFHGMVFSIIFERKFWIIPPLKISSRITDLLSKVKLLNRVVNNLEEIKEKDIEKSIDYKSVKEIIFNEQVNSLKWIKNAIDN